MELSDEEFDYGLESHHCSSAIQTTPTRALASTISAIDVTASTFANTPQQDAVAKISQSKFDTSIAGVHRFVQSYLQEFLTPQKLEAFFVGDSPEDLDDHLVAKAPGATNTQSQIDSSQDDFDQAVRDQIHLSLHRMRKQLQTSSQVNIA